MFIMIPRRLIFSLSATFSLALTIFLKKLALMSNIPAFELFLQFVIISSIVLSINFFLFQREYLQKIKETPLTQWRFILLAGFFLFFAYLSTTFGLRFTSSINYSFLTRSSLIFTSILAYLYLKEKMYWEKVLLIIWFFIGIYLVTTRGKIVIPQIGDLLILLGAFFFSSFTIIQKRISIHLPPEMISWGVSSVSALLAIFTGILLKVNLIPTNSYLIVVFAGITEAIVILFMNKTINIANVTYYSMMTMLLPIINGFLGVLFLEESLHLIQVIGGALLIVSGILVQKLKH